MVGFPMIAPPMYRTRSVRSSEGLPCRDVTITATRGVGCGRLLATMQTNAGARVIVTSSPRYKAAKRVISGGWAGREGGRCCRRSVAYTNRREGKRLTMVHGSSGRRSDDRTAYVSHTFGASSEGLPCRGVSILSLWAWVVVKCRRLTACNIGRG